MRPVVFALLLVAGGARADFVRGTVKVDVRAQDGSVVEAKVTLTPTDGGEAREVPRVGQVYVADGLVPGSWRVEVDGAEPQTVQVTGRLPLGVVALVGDAAGGKRTKKTAPVTAAAGEPACDHKNGMVVEAVAFARGGLAAGRLEVRRGGKLVCVATLAGGGATLRLAPGDYALEARLVGGGIARAGYSLREGRSPPPLVLRAK
jgi:hypothetical protein